MFTSPLHNGNSMAIDSSAIASPTLLSSRTRKRHRDNRPNEEIVHPTPIQLLPNSHNFSNNRAGSSSPSNESGFESIFSSFILAIASGASCITWQ
ncbi:hypothetical protein ACMFMG_010690 [Clarireedia jacksonii]